MNRTVLTSGLLLCALGVTAAEKPRPNVLFIAVDDLNDYISPLGGHPQALTPNLERLAKMGVTFTKANCAAPASSPSRAATMTGVSPHRSDYIENEWDLMPVWRAKPAYKGVATMEEWFRNNGYTSMASGKIYHALQWWPGSHADPSTWDRYFPSAEHPIPDWPRASYDDEAWKGKPPIQYFVTKELDLPDEKTSDYAVVSWISERLEESYDKPFFLACGIFRPHIPWEVPQKYFDLFPIEDILLPVHKENDLDDAFSHGRQFWHKWIMDNDLWKRYVQGYLASIAYCDAQLGRLLDAFEKSKYKDNTIIMLWADHGMHIGEKENWEKFTLWEKSAHIPLFFALPGGPKGVRWDKPVSSLDIFPTLCDLTGLSTPEACDGVSLAPVLKGKKNFDRKHPVLTIYRFDKKCGLFNGEFISGYSLRTDDYRYICYTNGFQELYDHRIDPNEFDNIAPANKQKCAEFKAMVDKELSLLDQKNKRLGVTQPAS